jgi:uncharacterized protein GlcG (DUF336 family)
MGNHRDQVPLAWKEGNLCYTSGITLDIAKKMLDAAEAEAKKQGLPMVMAIVDAGGNLMAFHRMDNAMLCSIEIAEDKAFTAVFGKLPTQAWHNTFRSGSLPSLFFHNRWTPIPGGFPIIHGGYLLGGIGASGGTGYEDTCVARAALLAGGFTTEDADAALREINGV